MKEIREILRNIFFEGVSSVSWTRSQKDKEQMYDQAEAQINDLIKQAVDAQVKKDAEIVKKELEEWCDPVFAEDVVDAITRQLKDGE